MNQSEFLATTWNLLKARGKSREQGAIGFGFSSHWLKNRCKIFKPITERNNRNRVITFDSHSKTALLPFLQEHTEVTRKFGMSRVKIAKTNEEGPTLEGSAFEFSVLRRYYFGPQIFFFHFPIDESPQLSKKLNPLSSCIFFSTFICDGEGTIRCNVLFKRLTNSGSNAWYIQDWNSDRPCTSQRSMRHHSYIVSVKHQTVYTPFN